MLSIQELDQINSKKLATPNKLYYGDNEKVYVGTKEGKLKLLENGAKTEKRTS